ncbi:hypothetical protein GARC_4465 [Paraglaciecola arctica BSs20135]|uniref:Uncharacterized protein n=1 Tax=Paraglaciecola arctica BSs20135 TaxID=493475 RepID=K6YXC3_9ALTE|nr:hypothetical protein GARC_4461 [Paraglaciecola arctica BSs20135]GAC21407.1 hypothetical protein GARC_4465 [Paraglaciecola arctica BSs20135]
MACSSANFSDPDNVHYAWGEEGQGSKSQCSKSPASGIK